MIILNNSKKNNKNCIKAVLYGKKIKENIKLEFKEKNGYYENLKKNKETIVKILNKKIKVVIKEVKKHPFKKKIEHIDFLINN
ncbi:MAG: hypothetical protein ACSHUF_00225 [Candidatus Nasuia deltocephalinicola]